MSFDMCSIVMIDDGITFKGVFIAMCEAIELNYWCFSRGNHRGNSVEIFYFFNKTQAPTGTDRGAYNVVLQNAKTGQYTQSSAPIDNADVT